MTRLIEMGLIRRYLSESPSNDHRAVSHFSHFLPLSISTFFLLSVLLMLFITPVTCEKEPGELERILQLATVDGNKVKALVFQDDDDNENQAAAADGDTNPSILQLKSSLFFSKVCFPSFYASDIILLSPYPCSSSLTHPKRR